MKKIILINREFHKSSACTMSPGQTRRLIGIHTPEGTDEETNRAVKKGLMEHGYENNVLPGMMSANNCPLCNSCIQLRIVVSDYKFSASERKLMHRNRNYATAQTPTRYSIEQFALYLLHFAARIRRLGCDQPFTEPVYQLIARARSHTQTISDMGGKNLHAVMYYDDYGDSLYAAHQVYDPALSQNHSFGRYGLLKLIEHARQRGNVKHIYIGYWVKNSPALDYKKQFQPLEAFINGEWVPFDPGHHTAAPHLPVPEKLSIELT
ncbi:MAG: hypothetical protein HYS17_06440 [Micavibrio aeruginosavorus]|uniref:N-end rule aminoacyl transferase C-terminal domain-containing protein n=1 Tax=Micavibrio aeruginosavorus TaxID=349221 RepID=A0A7T5UFV8_9BACT|nr:MAG: hypothetical protein HYS17_06440 [Micavibrio aeruginosavorus]